MKKLENDSGNVKKELKEYPNLYNIHKDNPFTVPEHYFQQLPGEIRKNAIQNKGRTFWFSASFQNISKYALTSVILVLLLSGIIYLDQQDQSTLNSNKLTTIEDEVILAYLMQHYGEELSEEMIADGSFNEELITDEEWLEDADSYLEEYLFNHLEQQTIEEELYELQNHN